MNVDINKIVCGDNLEVMPRIPNNSVDAIITDPPYGLRFMGKTWDGVDIVNSAKRRRLSTTDPNPKSGITGGYRSLAAAAGQYDRSPAANFAFYEWSYHWAKEVLRIGKPGAMMLVFGGTRTVHRLTCAVEDAGWQIRDKICWLFGSGFPKSLNISKAIDKAKGVKVKQGTRFTVAGSEPNDSNCKLANPTPIGKERDAMRHLPDTNLAKIWSGYGTALKPAHEDIVICMKPLDGTFAANAEKWGVAGLNIDGGRIGINPEVDASQIRTMNRSQKTEKNGWGMNQNNADKPQVVNPQGRWPPNVILDEISGAMLDEQSGNLQSGKIEKYHNIGKADGYLNNYGIYGDRKGLPSESYGDSGGASRFFYCAKASRAERELGLKGHIPCVKCGQLSTDTHINDKGEEVKCARNNHPTVKTLDLMKYLCRLVRPPTDNPILLDPFTGSGTTLMAAVFEGWNYIGIEKDKDYCEIAEKRIAWAKEKKKENKNLWD